MSLFQPQAAFFNVVGSLTQPIFDGGRILGNFELTKAQTGRTAADLPQDGGLSRLPMSTTRWWRSARPPNGCGCSARWWRLRGGPSSCPSSSLRAGTADIVTVLNTQLTLFQAEDSLSQAQLARLLAIVSLYQALGGGWEPRMERPVDAL